MRSRAAAKRLLRRLPAAVLAALAVWFVGGSELWNRGVTAATETALRLVESPKATFLSWDDDTTILIRRSDFPAGEDLPGYRNLDAITFNVVILLTLLWATPRLGGKSSFFRGVAALLCLFASHVVHFALAIETLYATDLGPWSAAAYPRWQRETVATGRYFFDIALKYALPFVFWGVLVALPKMRETEDEPATRGRKRGR